MQLMMTKKELRLMEIRQLKNFRIINLDDAECFKIQANELIEELQSIAESTKDWQTIETAPKYDDSDEAADNSILLLTDRLQIVEGYWTPNGKEWISILYNKEGEVIFNGFTPIAWKVCSKLNPQ